MSGKLVLVRVRVGTVTVLVQGNTHGTDIRVIVVPSSTNLGVSPASKRPRQQRNFYCKINVLAADFSNKINFYLKICRLIDNFVRRRIGEQTVLEIQA